MAKSTNPDQHALFGSGLSCPDVGGLPLISEPAGAYEVLAPGSLYQPLLLNPAQKNIDVSPAPLDEYEEKFVRDLLRVLYPAGNPPRSPKTPLVWQGKELWIKRNIEKNADSFRLRIDESDWYYPDFIVWIIDKDKRIQTLGFVDPKGLTMGVKGWGDYKVLSTLYMPHVVEQSINTPLSIDGEEWTFRIRGILLSNTKYQDLVTQEKLFAHNAEGQLEPLSENLFNRARIVFFQKDKTDYINKILTLLEEDNDFDDRMHKAAKLYNELPITAECEADYDLLIRHQGYEGSESGFVANIVRDYLLPNQNGDYGYAVSEKRRGQLINYAKEGKFGLGHEKAKDIATHPAPCQELWQRMNK